MLVRLDHSPKGIIIEKTDQTEMGNFVRLRFSKRGHTAQDWKLELL